MLDKYPSPKLIAEIGCNHKGELKIAKELVDLAVECNADVVKFQKRTPKLLLSKEQYDSPHPNSMHSYGKSYGEHREFLELDIKEHSVLKSYCEGKGIIYSTSVWDVTSAEQLIELKPELLKIPSACNTNFMLLETLRDTFKGDIHLSFGMTTIEE